jgi:hypothetical protein
MPRLRTVAVLVTLFIALLLMPGRAVAEPGGDSSPALQNLAVTPNSLPHTGGSVIVTADVIGAARIQQMYALVDSQGYYVDNVQMLYAGQTGEVLHFSGTTNIQPNYSFEDEVDYGFTVMVTAENSATDEETAGIVTVERQPQFDEAPVVTAASASPADLPAAGGEIVIKASAYDTRSLSGVYADITKPGGATETLDLTPTSSSDFEGVYTVPKNTTTAAQKYSIRVYANDDIGQQGFMDTGPVTVAAYDPKLGTLTISRDTLSFGPVWLGNRGVRKLLLSYDGPKTIRTIKTTITVSGARFEMLGYPGGTREAWVRRGQTRNIFVAFKPTAVGPRTGELRIHPAGGVLPDLVVPLTGSGWWHP